jgi:hypothetical protein
MTYKVLSYFSITPLPPGWAVPLQQNCKIGPPFFLWQDKVPGAKCDVAPKRVEHTSRALRCDFGCPRGS